MQSAFDKQKKFEAAYDELIEPIFGFLYRRLNDRERAKELAQETFMRAWKYMADGNTIHLMRPFLYTTAYNLFKNELRAKKEVVSLEKLMDASAYEPSSTQRSAEAEFETKMLIQQLDALPPLYRKPMVMRYVDDMPIKKIADILGESATTISVRIHRGIDKLRTEHYETLAKKYT